MLFTEQLARERTRSNLKQAEQLRYARRLRRSAGPGGLSIGRNAG